MACECAKKSVGRPCREYAELVLCGGGIINVFVVVIVDWTGCAPGNGWGWPSARPSHLLHPCGRSKFLNFTCDIHNCGKVKRRKNNKSNCIKPAS